MKVVLIGSPQTQWNIGNRFLPGGTELELSDAEVKKHSDCIYRKMEEPKTEKVIVKPKTKKYTKEGLTAMNKAEQEVILKKLGYDLPLYKLNELKRVNTILKLQG